MEQCTFRGDRYMVCIVSNRYLRILGSVIPLLKVKMCHCAYIVQNPFYPRFLTVLPKFKLITICFCQFLCCSFFTIRFTESRH